MRLLITGGAGFIGTNCALHFLPLADKIFILDSFNRPSSAKNADFLVKQSGKIIIAKGDVRDFAVVKKLAAKADVILHLAAQVAVTTSIKDPQADFETNTVGSFNVLDAVRQYNPKAIVLYASTNKVYGSLESVAVDRKKGVDETTPIDLYSPYGCSKGAADLYFLDYHRTFGLKTMVFRQSCIYGPHQYGVEDQGWLAYFVLQLLKERPITIYGSGRQVRDLLYVDDLVKLYKLAVRKIELVKGQVFNIGGGIANSLSIRSAIGILEKKLKVRADLKQGLKRLGDQDYFVSNNTKAKKSLGWAPETSIEEGLDRLIEWCRNQP
jgi:CDP-paratose 2-epimerase